MGIIYIAGRASEMGRAESGGEPPARPTRNLNCADMSTKSGHTRISGHTRTIQQVSIYRCCANCGKGDTPLSKREHCEMCGAILPVFPRIR